MATIFEWDESKAEANVHKRGVNFDEAQTITQITRPNVCTPCAAARHTTNSLAQNKLKRSRLPKLVYQIASLLFEQVEFATRLLAKAAASAQ